MPTGRPRPPALPAPLPVARQLGPTESRDALELGTAVAPGLVHGLDGDAGATAGRLVGRRAVLRTGLLAGAASALTGCGLLDGDVVPFGPEEPPDTGDLAAALADEERLLAAHLAAAERHPGLAPRLLDVRADHAEHRRVLRALLTELDPRGPWAAPTDAPGAPGGTPASTRTGSPRAVPASTPGRTPDGTPGPGRAAVPAVPSGPADALAALVDLERRAAAARTEQAVTAAPTWAPLLGVLAASEAAHAAVLGA